ncbi:cytochrome c biogenesis protein CcdA [Hyphomicrobium sp. D-2]|uniref:cytochrome c biogenesis protein CcdA n=1 Tax=Hyphomicrobium sp. D-2 TaxID=3041621 RepID=UPI002454DC4F|nr:cytochrome c biogenesis protein CcdA [Hyphomicrobium sp. D-2]MDH4980827.1 methylamine utilization protein MauF [Hyphomicrobium sp. D-2]
MAETWQQNGHSFHESAVEGVEDVMLFARPWSATARFAVLALSAIAGAAAALHFASGVALETAMLWLLVPAAFAGGLLSTWSPCGYSSVCLLRPNGSYSLRSVAAWTPTLIAHFVGYGLGALALGGALGYAGYAMGLGSYMAYTIPVFAVLLAAYGAHQLGFLRVPYPQRRCQVPHDARQRFPKWVIGLLYGFSLGLNYLTYVQTPLLYAVTGAALFSGNVAFAIGIFLVFNLGRFLPLMLNALPMSDRSITAWLAKRQEQAAMLDGAILVAAGTAVMAMYLTA